MSRGQGAEGWPAPALIGGGPGGHLLRALSPEPRAFSLVEVVVALAILSVGLVGAMRVFPLGLRASQRAEQSNRGVIAAQRAIESLKLKSWDELVEGETTAQDDGFNLTTRIGRPNLDAIVDPTRLKVIEVTVRSVPTGRARELTFITYARRETQ